MLAGIKFIGKSEAEKAVEEDRRALKKQKKKEKKVQEYSHCSASFCTCSPLA